MTTYYLVVDTIREKRIIRKYIIIMDQPLNIDKFKEKLQIIVEDQKIDIYYKSDRKQETPYMVKNAEIADLKKWLDVPYKESREYFLGEYKTDETYPLEEYNFRITKVERKDVFLIEGQ